MPEYRVRVRRSEITSSLLYVEAANSDIAREYVMARVNEPRRAHPWSQPLVIHVVESVDYDHDPAHEDRLLALEALAEAAS